MLAMIRKFRGMPVLFRRFIQATFCLGIAGGIFEAIFNNFLSDTFQISAVTRGLLEFPRELPGFLVVVTCCSIIPMKNIRFFEKWIHFH